MRKASLSRMPMTIAWALSHSLLRRRERTLRCWSVDRIMKAAAEGRARRQLAVAGELDPLPEFVAQRAEHAGLHVADARGFSAAEGAEGKGDLARFLVDLRPGPRLGAIQRVGDDPEHLPGGHLRILGRHAIVETDDVLACRKEKADCGDEPGV